MTMRILYHHRTLGDGAEAIHIEEMVTAFRDLGHEVRVCGLAAEGPRSARTRVIDDARRLLPAAIFDVATVAGNAADYLEVRREIRRYEPHFMYKRHARNDIGALSAARRSGVPSILEVNCLFSGSQYQHFEPLSFSALSRRIERRALRLAGTVLAVSTPLAREIETLAATRAVVMPNGVDPLRFDPKRADTMRVRRQYGLPPLKTVGWAGILRDWHGLDLLLQAVAQMPEVVLLLVGDGPARAAIERHAAELHMTNRLVVTGRVPHASMPDYLAAMDIAVVADDRTGVASPMKLVEYMAMGLPIVAPRLENIENLVLDEVNALLFDPGNSAALAAALTRLVKDPALRATLGIAARTKVEGTLNWRANAEAVVNIASTGVLARQSATAVPI